MELTTENTQAPLAIHGGEPVRKEKMPPRLAVGKAETAMLMECLEHYHAKEEDPGYDGHYEKLYCDEFSEYMGGGYSDAISCGTAGIWIGLKAFSLPPQSDVLISPVTDSGPLAAIILQGHRPVLMDSAPNSYNTGLQQFLERITPKTRAAVLIHAGGEPMADINEIMIEAKKRNILILEDCSQAPGGHINGVKVGAFGDYAAYSTMYRKNLAAGGSSGITFTKNLDLYRLGQSHADRGKPVWKKHELDLRNPGFAFFPALNFNSDELRCAIGLASLRRLDDCNERRRAFLRTFLGWLSENSKTCTPFNYHEGIAPFYFPILVDTEKLKCTKMEFAKALMAEGVGLGEHYGCLISTWPWAQEYLSDNFVSTNAIDARDRAFHLYVNENYTEKEAMDIIKAIVKVENHFSK